MKIQNLEYVFNLHILHLTFILYAHLRNIQWGILLLCLVFPEKNGCLTLKVFIKQIISTLLKIAKTLD